MDIKKIKELRAKAHSLDSVLQVGKGGITTAVVKEVLLQLKKKKLIKIKFLQSAGDRKELVDELVSKTKAVLIRNVGRVVILHKG